VYPKDVDDIEQDVWITAFAKLALYDRNRGPFIAWARNLAHWRIIEHYRNRKREGTTFEDFDRRGLSRHAEDSETSNLLVKAQTPADPDRVLAELELREHFLRVTFCSELPPHQLIVFGFAKLLEWTPREIVAELSDLSLGDLHNRLECEYLQIVRMRRRVVHDCFRPLRERMEPPLGQVIADSNTRRLYEDLLCLVAGKTILSNYYTRRVPEENVAQWCGDVKKRILPRLLEDLAKLKK